MQAVIIAGGKGTRLRPYTNILPKPLLPLGLRSILEINIRQLVANGVDDILIAVGYLGELIQTVIGDGKKFGTRISYSYEKQPLGTVGALSLVIDRLEDDFIVMNGDILHNLNFSKLFEFHQTKEKRGVTISTYKQLHKVSLGILRLKCGEIVDYVEKPTNEYNVSIGIYVLNKEAICSEIISERYLDFPNLINQLLASRKPIYPYEHTGVWVDLGTHDEYTKIMDDLDRLQTKFPEIPILQ